MSKLAIGLILLLSSSVMAGQATCERNVAAKILNLQEVDGQLEKLAYISNLSGAKVSKDRVRAFDSENSIYFYAYQMAEAVCEDFPNKKIPTDDDAK